MLPGVALMQASMLIEMSEALKGVAIMTLWFFMGIAVAIACLEYEARRFQREIDALDSLAEGT